MSRICRSSLVIPAGLTAATMAELLALQKMRMMMGFHGNGEQPWQQDADRTTSPSELDDAGRTLR